jgi:HD-GYP domain-containing protein (c-di-GMP phosphodiesterase class II)
MADALGGGIGLAVSAAALVEERGAVLLDALERHLPGSREHADAVAGYAFAIAAELGLDRGGAELVREAARLHEVGVVYVPAALLARPPERLSPAEAALVASHPAYGARLAEGAAVPEPVPEWIAAAAERFDGTGPLGLAGDRIPLQGRIIRVACACDSLLARPARPGEARAAAAVAGLRDGGETELDPRVVEATSAIIRRAAGAAW